MQLCAIALRRDSMTASILVGGVIDFFLPPCFVRDRDLVIAGEVREYLVVVGGGVCRKEAIECGEGSRLATNMTLEGDGGLLLVGVDC